MFHASNILFDALSFLCYNDNHIEERESLHYEGLL